MCPLVPAPAALYVPWPWQAPLNWLGVCAELGVVIWFSIWLQWRMWNALARTARRLSLVAALLWGLAMGFVLVGLAILLLVTGPSMDRNEAWYNSQLTRYSALAPCSLSDLFAIGSASRTIVLHTLYLALGFQFLAVFLLAAQGLLRTWQRPATPQLAR